MDVKVRALHARVLHEHMRHVTAVAVQAVGNGAADGSLLVEERCATFWCRGMMHTASYVLYGAVLQAAVSRHITACRWNGGSVCCVGCLDG